MRDRYNEGYDAVWPKYLRTSTLPACSRFVVEREKKAHFLRTEERERKRYALEDSESLRTVRIRD